MSEGIFKSENSPNRLLKKDAVFNAFFSILQIILDHLIFKNLIRTALGSDKFFMYSPINLI